MLKLRPFVIAAFAAGASLFGAAAHAGTHWSVGINLPLPLPVPGLVVSNGGYYADAPAPVYYAPVPAPRYVAPEPYYEAPRVYAPPRVVYAPAPEVVYRGGYRDGYGGWYGDRDARWERHREFERARWEHERREQRGDDRDGHRWHRD